MILRVQVQKGRRVHYVPGWDCHGLPIELKAVDAAAGKHMTPAAIRQAARKLAADTILQQMKSFRSYAVMADWDARWATMDREYEIRQLRLFQKMARRGLVYRRFKPVYWSPSSGTALAEAELEYNENHVSRSAYIRFPIVGDYGNLPGLEGFQGKLYAVIWTTTPWTLPANRAIAVHEDLTYHIVKVDGDAYLVAENCLGRVAKILVKEGEEGAEVAAPEILGSVKGRQLTQLCYVNALRGKSAAPQPIIHGHFVTEASGSGLVHCAPGHGFDDYQACLPLGIPVDAPVDNDGLFTEEAYPDDPARLKGRSVLEDGGPAVLEILGDDVLKVHDYKHKYPYDWRTKKPIIIRATAQWFADVELIKNQAVAALEEVKFVPESGKNRLESFVKGRSEWCISRQRAWGVPIPALYEPNGNAVMTDEVMDHLIKVIEERGIDAWWTDALDDPAWLPESLRSSGIKYTRGLDTMDVWFDSGSSWTMLNNQQADLYLEGSDQARGWFQSSLLTRVAAMVEQQDSASGSTAHTLGLSPFKTLITHGFTLDKEGRKMSKSLGNVISADDVMDGTLMPPLKPRKGSNNSQPIKDALGPDALRLWVASSDYSGDVVLGEPVLKTIHQAILKYRTTIRMLTGSMHESARTAPLTTLDHIALIQLRDAMDAVGRHYANFEFNKAFMTLNHWLTNDLSAFYLEALKDRLYCADGGGVLEPIFIGFLRMLAPMTPVLVEEAWEHRPEWLKADSKYADSPLKHLYEAPLLHDPSRALSPEDEARLRKDIPVIMRSLAAIKAASEKARTDKVLGSSLACNVVLHVPEGSRAREALERYAGELDTMFVVSAVEVGGEVPADVAWKYEEVFEIEGTECKAVVIPPRQAKCPRCWRYVAEKEDVLCGRCEEVVGEKVQ